MKKFKLGLVVALTLITMTIGFDLTFAADDDLPVPRIIIMSLLEE